MYIYVNYLFMCVSLFGDNKNKNIKVNYNSFIVTASG